MIILNLVKYKSLRVKQKQVKQMRGIHYLALLCFVFPPSAFANTENNHITAFTELLAPYQFQSSDGKLSGLSIDIFNELTAITGDISTVKVMSWARAYEKVQNTPNSIIFSMARTSERENKFLWVGSIVENQSYFWGLKKRFKDKHFTFDEIRDHEIVVSRNSNGHNYVKKYRFPSVFPVVHEEQVIKMVYKGRVDFLMSSAPTLTSLSKKLSLDINELTPVHKVEGRNTNLSIAFNLASDTDLVAKYQNAFEQLKSSGKLAQLREKWGITSQF